MITCAWNGLWCYVFEAWTQRYETIDTMFDSLSLSTLLIVDIILIVTFILNYLWMSNEKYY